MINRSRLSIEIPFDLHTRLNDLLAGWRIKNRLFKALTVEIVEIMEKMTPHQRKVFIVGILESKITMDEWSNVVKEGMDDASKGIEKKT